jgi:hypothetical protein
MKRQIVQIAASENTLAALCDDGTIWALHGDWTLMPPIPQDPEAPEVVELRKFINGEDNG